MRLPLLVWFTVGGVLSSVGVLALLRRRPRRVPTVGSRAPASKPGVDEEATAEPSIPTVELTDVPPLPEAVDLAARFPEDGPEPGESRGLTLLAICLEGLEAVNRKFGPRTGERALLEVARAVRNALRNKDACARWEEDRFLAVLPGIDRRRASVVIGRVQRAVNALKLVTSSGVEIDLGTTVGSACAPEDGVSLDDLIGAVRRELDQARSRRVREPGDDPGPLERIRRATPLIFN